MKDWPDVTLMEFGDEVRTWLEEHLVGPFAGLRRHGLTGQDDIVPELQIAWERELATGGWLGIDFPESIGGLGAGDDLWCQGYSEPDTGSDLANIRTRAALVEDRWVITGQKVWTSLAQFADWVILIARTDTGTSRHAGLSYLLVPMNQPGIEIRPIMQITGGVEFNEMFITDAVTDADLVVGGVGNGWSVAMGTLAFERGASTLAQQTSFRVELEALMALARRNGRWEDPVVRQDLMESHIRLEILRFNQLRMLASLGDGGVPGPGMVGSGATQDGHVGSTIHSMPSRGRFPAAGPTPSTVARIRCSAT